MKKVLIGLLIAAAGTGIYFFILRPQKTGQSISNQHPQEWIIGQWRGAFNDSLPDSLLSVQDWEFRKEGVVIFKNEKPSVTDTLQYAWKDSLTMGLRKTADDSSALVFKVIHIAADSLLFQYSDSSILRLARVK